MVLVTPGIQEQLASSRVCERAFHRALWSWLDVNGNGMARSPELPLHLPKVSTWAASRERCWKEFHSCHTERDALAASLVRLGFIVRNTDSTCQASQQLYNMKPSHLESEDFVFLSHGLHLISPTNLDTSNQSEQTRSKKENVNMYFGKENTLEKTR